MIRFVKFNYLKSWRKLICLIAGIGVLLFIILTLIAMSLYLDNYSFTGHYFSDLGTTITIKNGLPNSISRLIFIIACVITGLSLIPFWIVLSTLFTETNKKNFLVFSGTLIGIASSFFLIALAILPYNIFAYEHGLTSRAFFLFFTITILIYSIVFFLNNCYNNIFTLLSIAFSIFSILYVVKIFPAFILFNAVKVYISPSLQKFIIYGFWLWIIFHIVIVWKFIMP